MYSGLACFSVLTHIFDYRGRKLCVGFVFLVSDSLFQPPVFDMSKVQETFSLPVANLDFHPICVSQQSPPNLLKADGWSEMRTRQNITSMPQNIGALQMYTVHCTVELHTFIGSFCHEYCTKLIAEDCRMNLVLVIYDETLVPPALNV